MSTYEPPTGSAFEYEPGRHLQPSEPTPSRRRVWPWVAWPVSVIGAFIAGLAIGITNQSNELAAGDETGAAATAAVDAPDGVPRLVPLPERLAL